MNHKTEFFNSILEYIKEDKLKWRAINSRTYFTEIDEIKLTIKSCDGWYLYDCVKRPVTDYELLYENKNNDRMFSIMEYGHLGRENDLDYKLLSSICEQAEIYVKTYVDEEMLFLIDKFEKK